MIKLTVNGKTHQIDVTTDTPLLWALRDTLQLTDTKYGCGQTMCGTCTVFVEGSPVRACTTPVSAVVGRKITTIEGIDTQRFGKVVQEAWQKLDVVQCGYCQSGQIMSAVALLTQKRKPTDADIDTAMSGNLCRCATYVRVRAASRRKAHFGELALEAAKEAVPTDIKLKDPKDFRLIGKQVKRKDSLSKTNGTAKFTADVSLPGMLVAVVAHPPLFGATVMSFDASKTQAIKGVVDVMQIPQGVAVLASDTWSAKKGRDPLSVSWHESKAFKLGTDEILAKYKEMAKKPGLIAKQTGDTDKAFAGAAKVVNAAFDFPYGCIEDDLIRQMAAGELAGCAPRLLRYGVTADEAHRFGLPCGGTLELVLEPAPDTHLLEQLAERIGTGQLVRRRVALASGRVSIEGGSDSDACRVK